MNEPGAERTKRISKSLSYVLRHRPDSIGIALDEAGWTDVGVLLEAMNANGKSITRDQLDHVVAANDKQRFIFSEDGSRIRANQGHSVPVALDYEQAIPPAALYHGTVQAFAEAIRTEGLHKGKRHHVHLSETVDTATTVGQRRGRPVILTVQAFAMHTSGHTFYRTPNQVWLVDSVPPQFIQFPDDA